MLNWSKDLRTNKTYASVEFTFAIWVMIASCVLSPARSFGDEPSRTIVNRFYCPWHDLNPQATTFDCWLDGDQFRFRFTVDDAEVVNDDRVIFAIANQTEIGLIYCIELDANGKVRDLTRDPKRNEDDAWNCDGLHATGKQTDTGYVVSASIPVATLSDLTKQAIDPDAKLLVGLFRLDQDRSGARIWSSWQLPASTRELIVRSAMKLLPIQGAKDKQQSPSEESARSRSLRIATWAARCDWQDHLARKVLKDNAEKWFDRLADFPHISESWIMADATSIATGEIKTLVTEDTNQERLLFRPLTLSFKIASTNEPLHSETATWMELTETTRNEILNVRSDCGRLVVAIQSAIAAQTISISTYEPKTLKRGDLVVVTYEGLGSSADIAIYINGQRQPACPVEERQPYAKDHVSKESLPKQNRQWQLKMPRMSVDSLQLYDQALSAVEVQSLDDKAKLFTWSELSEREKADWIEHFARRVDLSGGYLQESIRHYRGAP